jgi:hypothetical protein
MGSSQLSPLGALLVGFIFIVCGMPAILIGSGVLTRADPATPAWVTVCVGLLFVVAGLTVILDYDVARGVGPDGDLPPGTPFAIRVANFALGMTIVGLMTTVFGWVAFGSGPRRFSAAMSLPFVTRQWVSSEMSGRVAFGAATVLMALMFICCTVLGIERLWRAHKG